MPRHFAILAIVVVVVAVVVAVALERHPAAVGYHLQAVPRQLQVAGDLRAQQAADVGTIGVGPAGVQLAADGGAADVGIAF